MMDLPKKLKVNNLKRSLDIFWLKIILKDPLNTFGVWLDPWWGWWNYRHHHLEQLQLCPKSKLDLCLVLLRVPKHFGLVQIFCVMPNTDLHIAPVPNFLCLTKRLFSYSKFSFCADTKLFGGALKFISIFDLAQNI